MAFVQRLRLLLPAILLAVLLTPSASAQDYTAQLSGNSVVPPTSSKGTGNVTFRFNRRTVQQSTAEYNISLVLPGGARTVELHEAALGQNGPLVAIIWGPNDPRQDQPLNGLIKSGTLMRSSLTGPLNGDSINDLQDSVDSGNVYVLVTTKQYPNGELRGQIYKNP